jgi:hypothetical protein
MSMGPVVECPSGLVSRIPMLASSMGVRVELLDEVELNGPMGRYVFKSRVATIIGERRDNNNVSQIWLHFPSAHAFNPLYWFADFRLSSKIECMLRENGAHSCKWDF